MTYMTPAEAQSALDRDLDWKAELTAGRRALETIAAMRTEYCAQYQMIPGGLWHQVTSWDENPNPYNDGYRPSDNGRIATRYVLNPENP